MDPFLGQITIFPYNFAPKNWASCNGQLLSIAQNAALYSLLGTTFGGNGTTNFALPDLRSRVAVGAGQGSGLSNYVQGQAAGTENVVLTTAQIPTHTHTLLASSAEGDTRDPSGAVLAKEGAGVTAIYNSTGNADTTLKSPTGTAGGGQGHSNMQPYLALNYCIALTGIYPSRS